MAALHHRDGWKAWLVCFSAVVSNILIFGSASTFGVIYPVLLDDFKEGKATTAKLIYRFGPRLVAIFGAIICAIGLFVTSFSKTIAFMYFSYGVVFGIGSSMTYNSNFDIVQKYFKRKTSLALGIMTAGAGASFCMGFIFEILITHVGWRNMYKCTSAMALAVCVSSLSYSPQVEKDYEPKLPRETRIAQNGVKHTSLFKNYPYIICCILSFFYVLGVNIPLVHLGRYALDSGLTLSQVGHLYITYGVSTVIGRIVSGKLCDLKCINLIYLNSFVIVTVATAIMFIQYAKDPVGLNMYCCVHGTFDGMQVTATSVMITRYTNVLNRTRGYGWFNQIISWGFLLAPPLGGFIADQTGSYIPAFYVAGSIAFIGGAMEMTLKCFNTVDIGTVPPMEVLLETIDDTNHETVVQKITVL
ncbi:monocarboxylate transporter 13-like isoform X2 [Actinia tenebrosa]|uniref:Monocarboxylate transporter 13-like isoform X2 n=1 Tax=Actinia tenebrosa TaxID=6105 RepID=A0A6P8ILW2_ACTTE|nr:monocarboxylate transporter 13-like isoform X2 [Actinia tenebrosa]